MSQITLGNGSNEILELVVRAFFNPGLEAVFAACLAVSDSDPGGGRCCGCCAALNYGRSGCHAASVTDKTRVVFIANPTIRPALLSQKSVSFTAHCRKAASVCWTKRILSLCVRLSGN
jgi:hypothetical protein